MKNDIAIGILAFNEEKHINFVLNDLITAQIPIFIIDDASKDNTNFVIKNFINEEKAKNIKVITNHKNLGAGESTKLLLETAKKEGFKYLVKVDGDNQFKLADVLKIIELLKTNQYDFIKSNRFWENGIEGKIPYKRYFGNLFATIILQFAAGTNKLFDPLNGLFAVNINIIENINSKVYPKRYGYPFYFTCIAAISFYRIYQINNTIIYDKQKSNLSSIRMFFTLLRLTFHFILLKIKKKIIYGKYQRSAFLDIILLISLLFSFVIFLRIFFIFTPIEYFGTSNLATWVLILIFFIFFNVIIFVESFKEERNIRNKYIFNEE